MDYGNAKAFIHIKVTEHIKYNSNIGCVLIYLQGGQRMNVCDVCGWEYDEEGLARRWYCTVSNGVIFQKILNVRYAL